MSAATQMSLAPEGTASSAAAEAIVTEATKACDRRYRHRLRALILTGSLARGEGSAVVDDGVCRLLGDAEFLLVFARRRAIPDEGKLRGLAESISAATRERGIACRVDLAGVAPGYLRRLPRHIFSYELRQDGRVVLGNPAILELVPEFLPTEIDREDAWRLLSNRMVEWLRELASVPDEAGAPSLGLIYATVKLWLDAATSLLVFLGGYEPSYRARGRRLAALAREPHLALPFPLADFETGLETATRWKLAPDLAANRRPGWEFCARARDLAGKLWCWEMAELTGLDPAYPPMALVQAWTRRNGPGRRWRGWLRAAREQGWLRSRRCWRHWRELSRDGSPRHCIYGLAAECVMRQEDFSPGTREGAASAWKLATLRRYLPVPHAPARANGCGWRALACDLACNYRWFVEKTRA
ncbi:MAG TPA: hypothetical protein VGS20_03365 [Candidatus Acidoferrales bacterium]|nr:hypothetical protein [Candidatus Acidoferrales bacterium]